MNNDELACAVGGAAAVVGSLNRQLAEAHAKILDSWKALGISPNDAADDPDTRELADSIRVSLQYERDRSEIIAEQRNEAHAEVAAWKRVAQAFREATGADADEARDGEYDPYLERAQNLYNEAVKRYEAPDEIGPPDDEA